MIGLASASATGFAADPELPARDELLDDKAMARHLGAAMGTDVAGVTLRRVKYRIGDSLRVLYRVDYGSRRHDLVAVRAFGASRPPSCLRQSAQATVGLDSLGAAGWVFPADRKLAGLRRFVTDAEARAEAAGTPIDEVELVAYAPEKHATLRCVRNGRTVGYAKLYASDAHRRSVAVHEWMWGRTHEIGLDVPRVLAVDDAMGLVMLSPVNGLQLAVTTDCRSWHALGVATGRLHGIEPAGPLSPHARLTPDRLRSAAALIGAARPDVADRAAALLDGLVAAAPSLPTAAGVVLHGDLHAKNAMLTGRGSLGFVDLDQAGIGAASADLGSALAALRYHDVVAPTSGPVGAAKRLLEGYETRRPLPPPTELAWYTAAALLGERALRAVNRVRHEGLAHLGEVLTLGHEILSGDRS